METKKDNLMKRNYYEYDNAFYANDMNISCWEQMQYQSLRGVDVDYFLVFCDDINIRLECKNSSQNILYLNNLGYNDKLFENHLVTEEVKKAEKAIDGLLELGKVVIFQTAMDYLHTCSWYHMDSPFIKKSHYAIIIGSDADNFFYVDSPPMRNKEYFIPHPQNLSVGYLPRKELLQAFNEHCRVGYIDINMLYVNQVADINKILKGIKSSFNGKVVGKQALINLVDILKYDDSAEWIFDDIFTFELVESRHKKIKYIMKKYKFELENMNYENMIYILDDLIKQWEIFKNYAIMYKMTFKPKIKREMANLVKEIIIPSTEQFIQNI